MINKEAKRMYDIDYRQKNKDKIIAYRKSHKEYFHNKSSKEYHANPKLHQQRLKDWYVENPWMKAHRAAKARCENPNNNRYYCYGKRGIKFLLLSWEIKYLWFRDKAYLMKKPSIDRIDNDGSYEMGNCRFIEKIKNVSPHKRTTRELRKFVR